ncbi:hypothetical protein ACTOB_004859 [Actinoplanes oblitus]|uniref:ABM domain-containing protein n=1 Tax=Actinoplanes oblitus TaxID=3040509 RepID=A0ABY8W4W7_9ACTN|nr:hypothetical protein [Actinoplanes oblitus]WIM92901.1 hypothetical protein ACTOB_004859 [Actinoplanes oblitus]
MRDRPLSLPAAGWAVARCAGVTAALLARRRVHLPRDRVGRRLSFGDGTTARIYRDTVVDRPAPRDPCVLVVEFRLRGVHGRGHALFRAESILNTPLFVGFPGFVSKLWLAHDEHDVYRGLYEWDGAESAAGYARALWWVLALVSHRASIDYRVIPGLTRADVLERTPAWVAATTGAGAAWWCPVAA